MKKFFKWCKFNLLIAVILNTLFLLIKQEGSSSLFVIFSTPDSYGFPLPVISADDSLSINIGGSILFYLLNLAYWSIMAIFIAPLIKRVYKKIKYGETISKRFLIPFFGILFPTLIIRFLDCFNYGCMTINFYFRIFLSFAVSSTIAFVVEYVLKNDRDKKKSHKK